MVIINKVALTALLDSGSTNNFINMDAAGCAGVHLTPRGNLHVVVANGDCISSLGGYHDVAISIGDEVFIIDCYGLALGAYDMVLGVEWLKSLGQILWDFGCRIMAFVRNGHHVLWQITDAPPAHPVLMAADADLLEDLLSTFSSLFTEPAGLPLQWDRYHEIRLLPGTLPVAVRPYRYAYIQKQELEWQCMTMLQTGIIRSSMSSFSAPVLLVKKSDGSWRFYVDYRALNAATIKDKFSIPVVEELLDELRGASFFTKLDLRSGYHQVLMHPDDIVKTAFCTHEGLFEFLVMPFALTNAPATFQAPMNAVLRPFLC
jgi:hypothetical protein